MEGVNGENLMGDVGRTVLGEIIGVHLRGLEGAFERWGLFLADADRAAVMDHVQSLERLSKTLNAGVAA